MGCSLSKPRLFFDLFLSRFLSFTEMTPKERDRLTKELKSLKRKGGLARDLPKKARIEMTPKERDRLTKELKSLKRKGGLAGDLPKKARIGESSQAMPIQAMPDPEPATIVPSPTSSEEVIMAPKHYLAFTPAPRWVTHSSASKEQSEHTPSTSASTAQEPPLLASTPSTTSTPPIIFTPLAAEPLPSLISETYATTQASECTSSSRTFYGPTRMVHMWNRQHLMMVYYDAEGRPVIMAPKHYLAFTPAPRWVTHSSASKEQSEHTPSTSASTAQEPPLLTSTPSTTFTPPIIFTPLAAEPLPSLISETYATTQASECTSSSRTFYGPTRMVHMWNRQHLMMVYYDAEGRPDQLNTLVSEGPDTSGPHDHLSQEELEEALARVDHAVMQTDWAEERASHLESIMRDMMSTLNVHFGVTDFEDMLAHISAPTAAPTLTSALAPASTLAPGDNDDDVDLGDF
ncbi:hypothetical protein COCNU_scaffold015392G000010 [Cocos nucifera]|nr:hypothetical protein [Cocos nucifera]